MGKNLKYLHISKLIVGMFEYFSFLKQTIIIEMTIYD